MKREPLVTVSAIVAAASALVSLLVVLGLPIDGQTKKAVLSVVATVAPLVVAFLTRPKVTPVKDPRL